MPESPFPSRYRRCDSLPPVGTRTRWGAFGSLIALPLQQAPRRQDNSVFIDGNLLPWRDQWAFLATVQKLARRQVEGIVDGAERRGRILGVRLPPVEDGGDQPWTMPPSRRRSQDPIVGELPRTLDIVLADQIYVHKDRLHPAFRNRLLRLAAFQNPEFYKAQAMRLSTFDKPRVIACAEDHPHHIGLPRGCLEDLRHTLTDLGIRPVIRDERQPGSHLGVTFHGELRPEQRAAADAMLRHDTGVLAATTAFGKTVVAASLIAERGVNTLVLVHRQQLLDQWVERLSAFLRLPAKSISRIGAGRKRPTGSLDVAIIQSLVRKGVVDDCVAAIPNNEARVILATGKYVGEGFDDPRLDTLILTLPVSWRGTIAQYAGRPHRRYDGKRQVRIYDYADLNVPMLARMFDRRCRGYEAIGYTILLPASAIPGWPADVVLPSDPVWKRDYSASVQRLVRDGVDTPLAPLFVHAARPAPSDGEGVARARSATEAFLYRRLETLPETKGRFRLNAALPIAFDGFSQLEVDLLCADSRVAVELDGAQHLADPVAYRRDRRKDQLRQENGYLVLRFLAEDVGKELNLVLDSILRALTQRRRAALTAAPLDFVRPEREDGSGLP